MIDRIFFFGLILLLLQHLSILSVGASEHDEEPTLYVTRTISGWTVKVDRRLLAGDNEITERAIELLAQQLDAIVRDLPSIAVQELKKVTLWFSPEYPQTQPRAEYHPSAEWLRKNGRNASMAKEVEFSNVRIFEAETNRMPNFVLHELAHAFHDRVLEQGFDNSKIRKAFADAKQSGGYEQVERWHGDGKPNTTERAYAMQTPQEYFAESTEAFFGRNDFYPFDNRELKRHDPAIHDLIRALWGL